MKVQILKAHKILVGSVGVATVSILSAGCSAVANLMVPPSCAVAPHDPGCIGPRPDAGHDGGNDAGPDLGADAHDAPGDTATDATNVMDAASDAPLDTHGAANDALVDATDATAG